MTIPDCHFWRKPDPTNMSEKGCRAHYSYAACADQYIGADNHLELRCKMLHNRFAGDKLKYLDQPDEGNMEMNGQIDAVGVNDGEELRRKYQGSVGVSAIYAECVGRSGRYYQIPGWVISIGMIYQRRGGSGY